MKNYFPIIDSIANWIKLIIRDWLMISRANFTIHTLKDYDVPNNVVFFLSTLNIIVDSLVVIGRNWWAETAGRNWATKCVNNGLRGLWIGMLAAMQDTDFFKVPRILPKDLFINTCTICMKRWWIVDCNTSYSNILRDQKHDGYHHLWITFNCRWLGWQKLVNSLWLITMTFIHLYKR